MTEATPLTPEQITQEDICAAVGLKYALDDAGSTSWSVRSADPREHPVTIAFARHRIAALSASPAPSGQGVSGEVRQRAQDWLDRFRKQLSAFEGDVSGVALAYLGNQAEIAAAHVSSLLAAPAPSCAPGEVERARAFLGTFALGFPMSNDERQMIAQIMAQFAALSPQGPDAKEGCALCGDGPHDPDCPDHPVYDSLSTTPSQRLDAKEGTPSAKFRDPRPDRNCDFCGPGWKGAHKYRCPRAHEDNGEGGPVDD